jgi:hypothetical protein
LWSFKLINTENQKNWLKFSYFSKIVTCQLPTSTL